MDERIARQYGEQADVPPPAPAPPKSWTKKRSTTGDRVLSTVMAILLLGTVVAVIVPFVAALWRWGFGL